MFLVAAIRCLTCIGFSNGISIRTIDVNLINGELLKMLTTNWLSLMDTRGEMFLHELNFKHCDEWEIYETFSAQAKEIKESETFNLRGRSLPARPPACRWPPRWIKNSRRADFRYEMKCSRFTRDFHLQHSCSRTGNSCSSPLHFATDIHFSNVESYVGIWVNNSEANLFLWRSHSLRHHHKSDPSRLLTNRSAALSL